MAMNIVMIIADQLSQRGLGCYGNRDVVSPHLDGLAQSGIRMRHAYTTCPLCLPARAAFWTGTLPHDTWSVSNARNFRNGVVGEGTPTMGSLFQAAGYDTVHFGKQHDNGALRGFTCSPEVETPLEACPAWPVNYDSRRDPHTLELCLDYVRQPHEKPFFLVADFNNPHDICNWVGAFAGEHDDVTPPGSLPELPGNFEIDDLQTRPLPIQYLCCSHVRLSQASRWTPTNYRHYLAAYYHFIHRLDDQVGRLLAAVRASDSADDTLIVFMADHGDGMTAHRMVTKQVSFYEETNCVPMLFAGGPIAPRGVVLDNLVSTADLLPTLCDGAGIKPPAGIYGQSFWPMLEQGRVTDAARDCVAGEWMTEWGDTIEPGRMIRTSGFKYTRYLEGDGEELYDLTADPGERRNLAGFPEYRACLDEHRRLLAEHVQREQDPFFYLAWRVEPRWRSHAPGYPNHVGLCAPLYYRQLAAAGKPAGGVS